MDTKKHIYMVDLTDYEPDVYFAEMTEGEARKLEARLSRSSYASNYEVTKLVGGPGWMGGLKDMLEFIEDADDSGE